MMGGGVASTRSLAYKDHAANVRGNEETTSGYRATVYR